MQIEFKETPVSGVSVVDDKAGIIEALVSVTGIVDNVNDIIEYGAYADTLTKRRPKGVWHHSWTEPIAKTLVSSELPPGDSSLPKQLPNGHPWPAEAGALKIRMQFNLNTPRGKQAYEDVKFFGSEQEWSIGYNIPPGGAKKGADGIRRIQKLDLYEYSPVLFGAMPHARTVGGVKDAQLAYKSAIGISKDELDKLMTEWKEAVGDVEPPADDPAINKEFEDEVDNIEAPDLDESDDDDYEEDFEDELVKSIQPATLRKAIDALNALLAEVEDSEAPSEAGQDEKGFHVYVEAKAVQYETLTDAVDGLTVDVPTDDMRLLQKAAVAFDATVGKGDQKATEDAASAVMDVLESVSADDDYSQDDVKDALAVVARVMADLLENTVAEKELLDSSNAKAYGHFGVEYKMVRRGSRIHGWPIGITGCVESRKTLVSAFVAGLDDDSIYDLKEYLYDMPQEHALKRVVDAELKDRIQGTRTKPTSRSGEDGLVLDISELKTLGIDIPD